MLSSDRRKYALADYTVEFRAGRGWYFGRQYDLGGAYHGPYKSVASVTLVIARQLRREIERRDTVTGGKAS
jgi:hypothetical protein